LEQDADRVVACKNVTAAEEYLADHFPGFPVLPGVMMLETLVQAGRLLAGGTSRPLVLEQVRNLRYGNMVRPGQTLKVDVSVRKRDGDALELQGVGHVGDDVAVQGRFRLAPLP